MITPEKKVSSFGNNVDFKDASFSSYLNENTMVLKLNHPSQNNVKRKEEDGEIGIFGAEKYFKGAMDEQLPRTPHSIKPANYPQGKDEESPKPKPKPESSTPSVRSESSWNSRSGLLRHPEHRRIPRSRRERTKSVKSLLSSFGCNCNDKASLKVAEKRVHVKELVKPKPKTKPMEKAGDPDDHRKAMKREDCFTFPATGVTEEEKDDVTRIKTRRNSSEAFGSPILEKGKKSCSLERKLTMLNWDGVTPKAENISKNGESFDAGSDASSDLFEIESFSTNGNNAFLGRQVSNGRPSTGYAPSEASIAWSVVTASVAGFSIVSDYEGTRTPDTASSRSVKNGGDMERMVRGSGMLSGCNSHKSVRVAGERMAVSGGEKAAVTVRTTTKERCQLDSIVPIMKFQAESKPIPRAH